MLPKFKAGQLVRLRADALDGPLKEKFKGRVWMLKGIPEGPVKGKLGIGFRWRIPEEDSPTKGRFMPFEQVLERVDHPPEIGSWDDCAWKPKELIKDKE